MACICVCALRQEQKLVQQVPESIHAINLGELSALIASHSLSLSLIGKCNLLRALRLCL